MSFWISWKGLKTKTDLLGSERSMLVPNLMIFPTDFGSELERRINLQVKFFNTVKEQANRSVLYVYLVEPGAIL